MEQKKFTRTRISVLSNGTKIKTLKPNESKKTEWTTEGWNARKWNIEGEIIDSHNGHGFYYDVKHKDGTIAGYNPEEIRITSFTKEDTSILMQIRSEVQSILLSEESGIIFYSPFSKGHLSRTEPDRHLVCLAPSIEKRNLAFQKMIDNKYCCKKISTIYEIRGIQGEQEKMWAFSIDLLS